MTEPGQTNPGQTNPGQTGRPAPGVRTPSILGSSAVMAAGTIVSRLSGFIRGILLAAALGIGLHADVFNIANTVPNMLYILLAGGVFNAVLVPQLVRSMKHDADGGEAYTNRIITLAGAFLLIVTVVLVIGAPTLMRLFLDPMFFTEELTAQRESVFAFARYCLPQVFFYGMFALLGQVLNARGRFGPMMWAPIANNVISVVVLTTYLITIGAADETQQRGGFSSGAEALLGIGSTLGIAAQLLVLLPYLKAAGVRYRPRFDFRGSGLGHTMRLGAWTVLFVVVNQIAYTVVVRLASSGTADSDRGTGYTVYSQSFLLVMVPHAIITVSLATAMLPQLSRLAADHDLAAVGRTVSRALRSSYALIVPAATLLALMAVDTANIVWGYGAAKKVFADFGPSLSMFCLGLVFFTAHYMMLRGFYALEQNRRVFWIQCVIGAVNIGAAVLLTRGIAPSQTAPRLVLAYTIAYAVGALISSAVLSRTVGGLEGNRVLRFGVRLVLAVAIAGALAWTLRLGLRQIDIPGPEKLGAVLRLILVGGGFAVVYLAMARLLRITEVTTVMGMLTRRLSGRR